jgi:hypothetical protein
MLHRHQDVGGRELAKPWVPQERDCAAWEKRVNEIPRLLSRVEPRHFDRFDSVYAPYLGDQPKVRAQLVLDGKLEVEAIAYKPA